MKKRMLLMFLVLVLFAGIVPVNAQATEATVYVTFSRYGEIITDKNGEKIACHEVELNGKSSYILDDVLKEAHALYFEQGIDGYASSQSEYGFGIDMFLGDTSGNFGYQINGGTKYVTGVDTSVEDGDYIDAFIYQNMYPENEGYSMFDTYRMNAYKNTEFEITLKYFSGYDENWNTIISPCDQATITINGEETSYVTDENGKAVIQIENAGTYILSAQKTKMLKEEAVAAITAPVCIVEIEENPAIQMMHQIAQHYSAMDYSEFEGNLPWIVADMMIYESIFPESEFVLDAEKKSEAISSIVNFAAESDKPGDLAKSIIALCSLGYDAKNIVLEDLQNIDILEKLSDMVEEEDAAALNIYTLPYVLIALSQFDDDIREEQLEYLIHTAIEKKDKWQSTESGTDAMTPMVFALAPYRTQSDAVEILITETIEIIQSQQREDGLIDGFEGYEPASTGLALCAFSAAGLDPMLVKNGGYDLITGLVNVANEEKNGYENAFATEQAFRGFLAWRLLLESNGKTIYDFSDSEKNPINLSGFEYCPVTFDVTPQNATISMDGETVDSKHCFDLAPGQYRYTVQATKYVTESGTIKISERDAEEHRMKNIEIRLSRKQSGSGGSSGGGASAMPDKPQTEEAEKTEKEDAEESTDADTTSFDEQTFSDVGKEDWYYSAVKYVYENELFYGTDAGFEPQKEMTRAMLVTVLHRYDGAQSAGNTNRFSDVKDAIWYTESIHWAAENDIVNGYSETMFAPDDFITREQLAVVLYRYAKHKGYDRTAEEEEVLSDYKDADSISDYAKDAIIYMVQSGIISGRTQDSIAPRETVTRAEVATMMMRFAEENKK